MGRIMDRLNPWKRARARADEYERRISELDRIARDIVFPPNRVYVGNREIRAQCIAGRCHTCAKNYITHFLEERVT